MADEHTKPSGAPPATSSPARERVLIVDDDRNVLAVLGRLVASEYEVRLTESAEEALTLLEEWPPDLILADVLMPGIGGHELLRRVRQSRRLRDVPVIMISGSPEEAVAGLETGATDYITKPFVPAHLMARLRSALRLSDVIRRYNDLLGSVPVGVFRVDLEGTVIEANATLAALLGYESRVDLIGLSVGPIVAEPNLIGEMRESFERGVDQAETECKLARSDGSLVWSKLAVRMVRDRNGEPRAYDGTVVDISAWKESEGALAETRAQLLHKQKLESIGELAAGIAHEINSPIQYIGDNIRFLGESFTSLVEACTGAGRLADAARGLVAEGIVDEFDRLADSADIEFLAAEVPESMRQSVEGVARVAEIVRALKSFAHPGSTAKTEVDLIQTINDVTTVARNEWKYVAELELHLHPSAAQVVAYSGPLSQALLNIIVNAAHAISDVVDGGAAGKGTITIETRADTNWTEIRISDTGTGIAEEIRDRMFEPFFTTKEVGKGSGQGLAIVREVIVDQHDGEVDVETDLGRGTTFTLRLPRCSVDKDAG